jgi:hypothetical protein
MQNSAYGDITGEGFFALTLSNLPGRYYLPTLKLNPLLLLVIPPEQVPMHYSKLPVQV